MFDGWSTWAVLAGAVLVYGIMTLILRALEPQGLSERLGIAPADNGDEERSRWQSNYRSTRMVVTTVRTGSVIAVVIAALEAAQTLGETEGRMLVMIVVAAAVLFGVIVLRTLLNRLADSCYEDVEIWMSPLIWLAAGIGRLLRLNRVAEYIYETESPPDRQEEAGENVLNVLQNIASKDLRGKDLMQPLSETVAVHHSTGLEDVADMMVELDLQNVLIYGDTIDDVMGTVEKSKVLQALRDREHDPNITTASIVDEVFFLPVSQQVASLFSDFKDRVKQTAVMLDEVGMVAGTLTYDVMLRQLLKDGTVEDQPDMDSAEQAPID